MSEFKPQPIPRSWYKYDWPLTANKPVPSQADYSPENVAPLIRSLASILGYSPDELTLRYEANTSNVPFPQKDDDIVVGYAGDGVGQPCRRKVRGTPELPGRKAIQVYNRKARISKRLKKFQDNSPANIEYFQEYDPCSVNFAPIQLSAAPAPAIRFL